MVSGLEVCRRGGQVWKTLSRHHAESAKMFIKVIQNIGVVKRNKNSFKPRRYLVPFYMGSAEAITQATCEVLRII
ncbi:hypothetical protein B9Q04_10710 [Candidatus Marsarchaeota G2 archaeon BE_D]|jgi:hypothetical protein|uniref:Uncharacterized protein n=1 Tax=Candidatus Marsarchaeota G2 archaeon BE_D TaxID=1978158 RepID=A0A2R6C9H0_9ARCH|nr:MAG: hypothetical protein B9Q04_10710 [Candidatus Marsarchaeota G2 archaeon BE_D]